MSLKPLVRWATFQHWTLRYTQREDEIATGTFGTPAGDVAFRYQRTARSLELPTRTVHLDEHGWEINQAGQTTFQFKSRKERRNDQP